ncbi:hypothetical protein COLO4_07644 [Corchorus olitorius]|uniref:Uncharacterized protein n=1 Tax=Corchorus olitorius TaxID=93759 RepID=A0A1R3KJ17_9ROSI|nr:hypothetical protein COLO4_07644 [Corchorus olitorius]
MREEIESSVCHGEWRSLRESRGGGLVGRGFYVFLCSVYSGVDFCMEGSIFGGVAGERGESLLRGRGFFFIDPPREKVEETVSSVREKKLENVNPPEGEEVVAVLGCEDCVFKAFDELSWPDDEVAKILCQDAYLNA